MPKFLLFAKKISQKRVHFTVTLHVPSTVRFVAAPLQKSRSLYALVTLGPPVGSQMQQPTL